MALENREKSDVKVNVCVFDLDGTLWSVNSHIDILNKYYKKHSLTKLVGKMYGKVFPCRYQKLIDDELSTIPDEFLYAYEPPFRKSALDLMAKYRDLGYKIVVISNAPERILSNVRKRLGIWVLHGEIGHKSDELMQYCGNIDDVVVITDNLTDSDLIRMANVAYIYSNEGRKKKFLSMTCKGTMIFMPIE